MLIALKSKELDRLIPAVATGTQFSAALGEPTKILQRLMISLIGGVITLLISQNQVASKFYSIWLIIGVVFLLYLLWGPILEASRRNSTLKKYPYSAILEARIDEIYTEERVTETREQANKLGKLELIENRRTWLMLVLSDQDGYVGKLSFPMEKNHASIREGNIIRNVVFSDRRDFSKILAFSDSWIPSKRLWVGTYPYLLRPAFEELCRLRLGR